MKRFAIILLLSMFAHGLSAQVDRSEVRAGNRKFRKGDYSLAEIDYRKALVKDSLSYAANYNLASALYRREDYQNASKALSAVSQDGKQDADYHFNKGDVALQQKDYAAALESFKQSLLLNPSDMDAKENYIYAKKMLENEQNQGGGGDQNQDNNDQNQDQNNQDQNQNQNNQDQNQNQDNQNQNQEQNQDNQDQNQDNQDRNISPQQAAAMLQAIQAKEAQTQDKVKKEKAAQLKSKQKEQNW